MQLRRDQVTRLTSAGCLIKPHRDLTPPPNMEDEEARNPFYDVLLPNNTVVRLKANRGEAILRKTHSKSSCPKYDEGFTRKLTWVKNKNGSSKVIGFTIQLD